MFVSVASPISFIVAQIISCIGNAIGSLLCELATAMSLFKILLVTNFSMIFPYDPNQLGFSVFRIAAALAFLPSASICAYQTYMGQMMTNSLGYLIKSANYPLGIPYITFYVIFWTVLCMAMMSFALVYIPYYIKKNLNSNSIQVAEAGLVRKEVNIKRILLGFLGFSLSLAVHVVLDRYNMKKDNLPQIYVAAISLNMMLTYFLLEKDVAIFIKRKYLLRIPLISEMARGQTVNPVSG